MRWSRRRDGGPRGDRQSGSRGLGAGRPIRRIVWQYDGYRHAGARFGTEDAWWRGGGRVPSQEEGWVTQRVRLVFRLCARFGFGAIERSVAQARPRRDSLRGTCDARVRTIESMEFEGGEEVTVLLHGRRGIAFSRSGGGHERCAREGWGRRGSRGGGGKGMDGQRE